MELGVQNQRGEGTRAEWWLRSVALNKQRLGWRPLRGPGPWATPSPAPLNSDSFEKEEKLEKNDGRKKERWLEVTGRGQLKARKSSCYVTQGDPLCSRNKKQASKSAFKASRKTGGDHIEGKKNPRKKAFESLTGCSSVTSPSLSPSTLSLSFRFGNDTP